MYRDFYSDLKNLKKKTNTHCGFLLILHLLILVCMEDCCQRSNHLVMPTLHNLSREQTGIVVDSSQLVSHRQRKASTLSLCGNGVCGFLTKSSAAFVSQMRMRESRQRCGKSVSDCLPQCRLNGRHHRWSLQSVIVIIIITNILSAVGL